MNAYAQWRRAAFAAILLLGAVVAWIAFAPQQIGGQAAYVIIDGNSMEPRFHLGDLVAVRRAHTYTTGEAVAYRNRPMDRFVFHRIIDTQGGNFVVRGDHNTWDDSYQPLLADIVGVYWFALPHVGTWIRWLREPLRLGIAAGLLAALSLAILFQRGNGKHMNRNSIGSWLERLKQGGFQRFVEWLHSSPLWNQLKKTASERVPAQDSNGTENIRSWSGALEGMFFLLAFILCGALVLGYFAFTSPLLRTIEAGTPYQHIGTFSYSASAPAGVYDSRTVKSGDPIFPALTCVVDMRFSYALVGLKAEHIAGTYQLLARVSDASTGWQRTLPLIASQPFTGSTFAARAPVDLCKVQDLLTGVQQQTGWRPGSATLSIVPIVNVSGTVDGVDLQDTFQPQLDFQFDSLVFSVLHPDSKLNPLNPTQEASLRHNVVEANTLSIFGKEFQIGGLRLIATMGLILSLAGLATLGLMLASLARSSQAALVQVKYGSLLVDARQKDLELAADTIEIATIDDLAKLAERNQTMILFQKRGRMHFYWVQAGGRTYRYGLSESPGGISIPLVQLEDEIRHGLERGEFEVYYQPILSLADAKVFGVEALLRWQHPERGLIPAADFLPAAEAAGLMTPLGDWLLGVACQQWRIWRDQGHPLTLSINLSEQQLRGDPGRSFRRVVQNMGVDPHCLQIEIPGPEAMQLPESIIPALQELKDLGLQISVDEATGSSTLSSISRFPLTGIKFERPVVERILDHGRAMAMQRMIQAARGQGLLVGAVGVETEEQMDFLREQRCNFAQGYLVGRPVSADQLSESLILGPDVTRENE